LLDLKPRETRLLAPAVHGGGRSGGGSSRKGLLRECTYPIGGTGWESCSGRTPSSVSRRAWVEPSRREMGRVSTQSAPVHLSLSFCCARRWRVRWRPRWTSRSSVCASVGFDGVSPASAGGSRARSEQYRVGYGASMGEDAVKGKKSESANHADIFRTPSCLVYIHARWLIGWYLSNYTGNIIVNTHTSKEYHDLQN